MILAAIGFAAIAATAITLVCCQPGEPCPRCQKRRFRALDCEYASGQYWECGACKHILWRSR